MTQGARPTEMESRALVDKLRKQSQIVAAGTTTVPLGSDEQSIARPSSDPSGAWRAP